MHRGPVGLSMNNEVVSEILTAYLERKNIKRHCQFMGAHKLGRTINGFESPYQFIRYQLLQNPSLLLQVAISQDIDVTYEEMMCHADCLANFLHTKLHSSKGELISICAISSIAGIEAFFAMNKLGLVNARIFNGTQNEKMHEDLMSFGSKTVFIDSANLLTACEAAKGTKVENIIIISPKNAVPEFRTDLNVYYYDDIKQIPCEDDFKESVSANDLAAILYTSGSSGDPKPIAISNRVYVNMVELTSSTTDTKMNDGEKVVGVVSHEYPYAAINSTLMILLMGKTLIMPQNEPDGRIDFGKLMSKKPYRIQAIPNFYKLLQAYIEDNKSTDLSFLKNVISGGETYSVAEKVSLYKSLRTVKNKAFIIDGFGFGEMGSATALKFGLSKYFLLMNGVEAMAVDPETNKRLPLDEEGVLCITGPTIADGYYNDDASTLKSFIYDENGIRWFKSDTYGKVHGKRKRLIALGGRIREYFITGDGHGNFLKVYSGKVEAVILENAIVKDCIVVQSDESALPTPVAFVSVKESDMSKTEIINLLDETCKTLEAFCRPTKYFIVNEIKRTKADKKDYLFYKEMAKE